MSAVPCSKRTKFETRCGNKLEHWAEVNGMARGHYPRADLAGLRGAAPWYVARLGADCHWPCGVSRNDGGQGGEPEQHPARRPRQLVELCRHADESPSDGLAHPPPC